MAILYCKRFDFKNKWQVDLILYLASLQDTGTLQMHAYIRSAGHFKSTIARHFMFQDLAGRFTPTLSTTLRSLNDVRFMQKKYFLSPLIFGPYRVLAKLSIDSSTSRGLTPSLKN